MVTTTKKIDVETSHPMEDVFDIEPGTTMSTKVERTTEMVEAVQYDKKDDEIDEQIQEIYDSAMEAFETQMDEAELVEGKYKARNGEVAVQFLNAALNAVKEKSGLKQHKDKIDVAKGKINPGKGGDTNILIADRNDILRNIMKGMDSGADIIDVDDVIEVDEEDEIDEPKLVNPPEE